MLTVRQYCNMCLLLNALALLNEFNNIQSWAAKNNLKIHPSKTKEIIFSRRRSKVQYPSEPFIPGAERVDALRVLGVILAPRLSMGAHLDRVIANCTSSRFALHTLRAHGLPPPELHLVTRMTTVFFAIMVRLHRCVRSVATRAPAGES